MQQIAKKQLEKLNKLLETPSSSNDTFLKGKLGLIYYYYHLYKATEKTVLKHRTESLLQQVFADINATMSSLVGPSLSTGGAGFGYVVNFMRREGLLEFEVDNEFEALDEYLFKAACSLIEEDNIDFLHGALGVVHYFADRLNPTSHINYYLDTLIEKTCLQVVEEEAGCWFRNNLIKVNGKQAINFSLSHGLCGILLVLINAYEKSRHKQLMKKMVQEGIRFMLKHKIDVDFSQNEYSFFPFIITQDASEISAPNQMSWCYGDLNQVLLFYRAGRLLCDDNLLRMADLIGMQSMMRRDERSTLITGPDFCHGTAGLAQFCKTLYHESGLEIYQESYEYWIERTILLLDEELGKGIYTGKEHEFMEGLIGVAFPLLSYISDVELNWSKVLLL